MTHNRTKAELRKAVEALNQAGAAEDDQDGLATGTDRTELAQWLMLLDVETESLRRRYGISPLAPRNQEPDFETRRQQSLRKADEAIGLALNYRSGTQPSGSALSSVRSAVEHFRRGRAELLRAGMESVAS